MLQQPVVCRRAAQEEEEDHGKALHTRAWGWLLCESSDRGMCFMPLVAILIALGAHRTSTCGWGVCRRTPGRVLAEAPRTMDCRRTRPIQALSTVNAAK